MAAAAMTAGLLAAAAVMVVAWMRRPAPARVRDLTVRAAPAAKEPAALDPMARLGIAVLNRVRPGRPAGAEAGRRLVVVAALAVPAAAVSLSFAAALVAFGLAGPPLKRRRRRKAESAALAAGLPEVVDLFGVAVGAGLTVHLAVAAVARRARGPVAAHLTWALQQVSRGRSLADALDDLPARAGESLRPLTAGLAASLRYGAPIGPGLERLAAEVRVDRRRRAEAAARRVPVKLLFPLVLCILPAFALLTVAPLVAGALGSLRF